MFPSYPCQSGVDRLGLPPKANRAPSLNRGLVPAPAAATTTTTAKPLPNRVIANLDPSLDPNLDLNPLRPKEGNPPLRREADPNPLPSLPSEEGRPLVLGPAPGLGLDPAQDPNKNASVSAMPALFETLPSVSFPIHLPLLFLDP